jgi:predicted site-specific integrase-resolvase
MHPYSTVAVARSVGISKKTLLRWLGNGRVPEPGHQIAGGQDVRVWSEADVGRVRAHKEANYRKGRGRKKKA